MTQTLEQQLADLIVLEIAAAVEPLQRKIADLEVSRTSWMQKLDQAQGQIFQLEQRLSGAESRALMPGPMGPAGPQGEVGPIGVTGAQGAPGEPGLNGKDGRDGLDGKDGQAGPQGFQGEVGQRGPAGVDGLDGKDGRDGLDGKDGARGLDGKDGVGVAGALLTKDCALVLTLSDGTVCDLGSVRGERGTDGLNGRDGAAGLNGKDGRDGMPGVPGRPGDKGQDGEHGLDGKAGLPGKDGKDGRDGKDGLGFDDLTLDEVKGWILKAGDREFRMPIPFDAGTFQAGRLYPKGSIVLSDGSSWIAQVETRDRPRDSKAWRLMVRRGSDGKPGPQGPPGRDA